MPIASAALLFGLSLSSELPADLALQWPAIPQLETSAIGDLLKTKPVDPPFAAARPPDQGQPDQGQEDEPATPHTGIRALFSGLAEDFKHLPSRPNLYLAATGAALALGVHPLDPTFNARLRGHDDAVDTFFASGKYYGDTPEQVGLSVATYAFGRLTDRPKVAHLGMDLIRAQILDEALTQALKFTVRRQRPDGSNRRSFPSGHASVTFATATVLERHLGWKHAVIAYAIASYVAASRLHDNVHYLSDVVFGAAVGAIAGRVVTEHGKNVWTFAPAVVPGGAAIVAIRAP